MSLMKRFAFRRAALAAVFCLLAITASAADDVAVATFAGGCFWCVESDFDKVDGVISTTSGYTGGHKKNPTYHEVSAGGTGHAESVEIEYDPKKVTYKELLDHFWVNHDPTTDDSQFCDHGNQYRPVIFYHNEEQKRLAEESKKEVEEKYSFPVKTEIAKATTFYPAEDYHQNYYKKNPLRYEYYRHACGRDARLKELWDDKKKP